MARDRLQNIFLHMKDRCYNPNFRDYKNYGGRGITICDEWQTPHSWKGGRAFKKWALENGYAYNLTLDRIKDIAPKIADGFLWKFNRITNAITD